MFGSQTLVGKPPGKHCSLICLNILTESCSHKASGTEDINYFSKYDLVATKIEKQLSSLKMPDGMRWAGEGAGINPPGSGVI